MPSIGKWYPFHQTSLELCIPLNCCRYTVFKRWINHKTRTLFRLFDFSVNPFGPFYSLKWQISLGLLFDVPQLMDSLPFHILEAWKRLHLPIRSSAGNQLRGTKLPCWRARDALGQDKQRKWRFSKWIELSLYLVLVRLLLSSMAVLYHLNDLLQRDCWNFELS